MQEHDPDLAAAQLSRRVQLACIWCGPAFVVLLFGGWGLLGGLIPLIPPSDSAEQVTAVYATNANLHRFGLILGMIGTFLPLLYSFAISMQMRRTERGIPVLSILQFASGIMVTVVLMIPMLLFCGAAFRPERSPELTMLVNDLSYLMLILPWPPLIGQLGTFTIAVLTDRSTPRVFPRWVAYYNIWVQLLLLPASLILFFKTGPFAWTGIIGFWIPAAVFGSWYLVMTPLLLTALRQETDRRASEPGADVRTPATGP